MSVYVGLDCGGSTSRVMAVDGHGKTLFQGHSGAANLVSTPEHRLKRNLTHATTGCPPATHVCGCFAGLINPEIKQKGIEVLRHIFPNAVVRAEPDYTAALYACPDNTDVCVIAGTGSLVCSKEGTTIHKSGGRGYILGDYGSGFQYGRDAIIHFLEQPDRRSEILRNAVLENFGTLDESAIIAAVYRALTPATVLGKLAKALAQDARAEEPYALRSLKQNSGLLAEIVLAHVERYFSDRTSLNVCLAGGLWKATPIFREVFAEELRARLPQTTLEITRIAQPPLQGAVRLAMDTIHGN